MSFKCLTNLLRKIIEFDSLDRHLLPIHTKSLVSGLAFDLFFNNLLQAYSKSRKLHQARKLFDKMPITNLISHSTIISMYTQNSLEHEAFTLFSLFRRTSYEPPSEFMLSSILRACVAVKAHCFTWQIHGLILKNGFMLDVFVGTALIDFYAKNGDLDDAVLIFDELPVKSSVTWTVVVSGFSRIGRNWDALEMFRRMKEDGVRPDQFVVSSVVSACAAEGFLEFGRELHGFAVRGSAEMDVLVENVLIDLYCKCERVEVARRLFDTMGVRNLVSWTTMIAGYMQNSFDCEAVGLFSEMLRMGWRPDSFACASVLSSCGSLMALKRGKEVHAYAIRAFLESDEYVRNSLLTYQNAVTD